VLHTQRAAALGIGLVLSFFITHTEGQFINQIGGSAQLFVLGVSILYLRQVVLPDLINAPFQSPRLLILLPIVLPLEPGIGCKEDVFIGGGGANGVVLVGTQPGGVFLALDRPPRVPTHVTARNGGIFGKIQSQLLRLDPRFEAAGFRMLPSALKQSWWFDLIPVDLLYRVYIIPRLPSTIA
jgi:hypothetical protein